MPTYAYRCPSCGKEFTALHKISECAPNCPACGGEVTKLVTAPAVHGGGRKVESSSQGHGCGAGSCGCKH